MDRRPIRQLAPSLINRIAAGEVIERPASVVKELVENALDAGAKHIQVDIEDGGRALVRVTDDGGGIPAEELELALASHATSKLLDDDDLFRITTMGFRGEALASIASVSHTRLLSRPHDALVAHEIVSSAGQTGPVQAASANVGTTIEVRDLFFNVPARRKFLRSTSTEFGHISQTVLRLSLPFEKVAFKLTHNGRTVLDLAATDSLSRMLNAWPAEFRNLHLQVAGVFGDASISGIVGAPELARPTQAYQFLYLNGRAIRDKFVAHALREAYRGLTEPGRHPAAILMLTIPPDEVDVNVHPTKNEVRFRDGTRLHGIIHSAVREKLLRSDLSPAAQPVLTHNELSQAHRVSLQEKLADFFKQPRQNGNESLQAPLLPVTPHAEEHGKIEAATVSGPRSSAIQLHNSYLVAQTEEGLIIIDQHALHERIIYEELLERLSRGNLESQHLLIPATLPASSRQLELLEQLQPLLQRLGIEARPFGPDSLAIHAFASFLSRCDPAHFMSELLERGEQELLDLTNEELLHEILDMMACKAAVKAGDALTPPEIQALLERRQLVERSSNCPHGRPTTLRLTLKDLEKQFKRTGF